MQLEMYGKMGLNVLTLLVVTNVSNCKAWGFFGHEKINLLAVYSIPKPLFGFYKINRFYMRAHAADPDNRRYSDTSEACRHFLDADFYSLNFPNDSIPWSYKKALEKFGEDTVIEHGIVPWHIMTKFYELTKAFKEKNNPAIMRISAELGHYVGDCHVPLHSTSNYNGQKTGQKGIHALWESRLTELNYDKYDLFVGLAEYLDNPQRNIWLAFYRSFHLVDSVLSMEMKVSKDFENKSKYEWVPRGNHLVKTYSSKFCEAYHRDLNGMVEERMRASIQMLASLIYTAWVNAGQPDLIGMPVEDLPIFPSKEMMIGREEE